MSGHVRLWSEKRFYSADSKEEYGKMIAQGEAAGRRLLDEAAPYLAIGERRDAFKPHVEKHYRDSDCKPTSEVDEFRLSIRLTGLKHLSIGLSRHHESGISTSLACLVAVLPKNDLNLDE